MVIGQLEEPRQGPQEFFIGRVHVDDPAGLIDGDAGVQGFHQFTEVPLTGQQRLPAFPALGDVPLRGGDAHVLAFIVEHRGDGQPHVQHAAVPGQSPGLERLHILPVLQYFHQGRCLSPPLLGNDLTDIHSQCLLPAVAIDPLGATVPGTDNPLKILQQDGVVGILQNAGQPAAQVPWEIAVLSGLLPFHTGCLHPTPFFCGSGLTAC